MDRRSKLLLVTQGKGRNSQLVTQVLSVSIWDACMWIPWASEKMLLLFVVSPRGDRPLTCSVWTLVSVAEVKLWTWVCLLFSKPAYKEIDLTYHVCSQPGGYGPNGWTTRFVKNWLDRRAPTVSVLKSCDKQCTSGLDAGVTAVQHLHPWSRWWGRTPL